MNETKSKIIEDLAADHERKRARFETLGFRNVYGVSAEQREQMAKEYAIAEAEMIEAGRRLRGAIGSA